jgi:signal transduction histidine kinase
METGAEIPRLERALEELRQENKALRSAQASLTQRLIGLSRVQAITEELASELNRRKLLKHILGSAIQAVEGTAGALLLLDPAMDKLVFEVVEGGGDQDLLGTRLDGDQGLAGWVATHNEPLIVPDVRNDERFFEETSEIIGFDVESLICVPMVSRGRVIGVIQVLNKSHGASFDDDDLSLLTSFAAQSATAVENARLHESLTQERDGLIAIEEEVRRQLARDLHDGPAQLLAIIISNIEFVRKLLDLEPEKVPEELEALLPVAHKALHQVRTLLFDLRPVILETQGLVSALESYVEQQQGAGGLTYHLQVVDFSGRLTALAERTIFSIVQEAVGNVKKHAQAQNVWITAAEQAGELLVEIRDDGQGFDADELDLTYERRGSLGMLNMRERAWDLGGRLSVWTQPGAGTTITLVAPLHALRRDNVRGALSSL